MQPSLNANEIVKMRPDVKKINMKIGVSGASGHFGKGNPCGTRATARRPRGSGDLAHARDHHCAGPGWFGKGCSAGV